MKADLNSEFFFSSTERLSKAKKKTHPVLLFVHPWAEGSRQMGLYFLKGISTKWNANSFVHDLNSGYRFHFQGL